MVFTTIPALTDTITLDAFVARLATHSVVDGILLMGSTGSGKLTATSDYDVLLILADDPAAPPLVVTWVDNHLTEVYCTPISALARIVAAPTTWLEGSNEGAVVNWLRDGRVVHDRVGRLAAAQEVARAAPPPPFMPPETVHGTYFALGYNVAQAKRYLSSDDPVYREAVDFRLLYSLAEVMFAYFRVRGLPWRGEKEAIKYWSTDDPTFLADFRAYFAETDREQKVARYEALARRVLAPVGELWAKGTTLVGTGAGWGAAPDVSKGSTADAHTFWRALVAPPSDG